MVKELIQVSYPTNNYLNKFLQYIAANSAITKWEDKIKDISQQCLNTNGFTTDQIKTDFYMISGTKPYDKQSSRNIKINDMAIPQLQWTAICCQMKIGTYDLVMSGGYITSNRKPDFQIKANDLGGKVFPIYPPYGEDNALMDLPMLKRGLQEKFEDLPDEDDVDMSVDHIFGKNHPCDEQKRSNEWMSNVIEGP